MKSYQKPQLQVRYIEETDVVHTSPAGVVEGYDIFMPVQTQGE